MFYIAFLVEVRVDIYHHSHCDFYRSPFGAVPCQTPIRLRIDVRGVDACPEVILCLWHLGDIRIPMLPLGAYQGAYRFETTFPAPGAPGLMWYHFEVWTGEECTLYGNSAAQLGGEGKIGSSSSYQISVYDPAYDTPHWMRNGTLYQIMVDRFCNGDPTGKLFALRDDVYHHAHWDEAPHINLTTTRDSYYNDFFGGNLEGVRQKLHYLKNLGITALYFNPIFKADSNHKYDTGDYRLIDPMFGTQTDFEALCREAKAMGMHVMLDGVFSHVGDDSLYFNRYGHYDSVGACQSTSSPYYPWFRFHDYPDTYDCWWGFDSLPNINEDYPTFREFVLTGEDAVVKHWLRAGASGWRLDVADELPMTFLRTLRKEVKRVNPDAAVLGEVWEDASNKIAYNKMRSYVLGDTLDSVMNYPLRTMLIDFLLFRCPPSEVQLRLTSLMENYPKVFFYSLMNLMGSHDRPRIINILCGASSDDDPREERTAFALTPKQRTQGRLRTRLMLRCITALPGMPCIYYGDETSKEGAGDPFCRGTYPWGQEDLEEIAFFRTLLQARLASPALRTGSCEILSPCEHVLGIVRTITQGKDVFGDPAPDGAVVTYVNRSEHARQIYLPCDKVLGAQALYSSAGITHRASNGAYTLTLLPLQGESFFTTPI